MEKQKTNNNLFKKILNVAYYVVVVMIIIFALIYTITVFSTKNGVTSLFGYIVSSVQSDSMSGTFEKGDVIVSKTLKDNEELKVNDVISFHYVDPQQNVRVIVTHRIIEVINQNEVVTQGDVAAKAGSSSFVEKVYREDIFAKYTGTKITGLGKVTDFLKTDVGFFCCILIPVFLFLFWQIYVFIKTLMEANRLSHEKTVNDEARALAEQMLKQMQENSDNAAVSDSSDNSQPE